MSDVFAPRSVHDVSRLVACHPLAWMVSAGGAFRATPLPMIADLDAEGFIVRLVGHMSKANPQLRQLEQSPRTLFLFTGPAGYVSPSWMADRTQAPTWNYATVQILADVHIRPDPHNLDAALGRLVSKMEAGRAEAWSTGEMGDRYIQLSDRIVAFDADVVDIRAHFKLGQDERPDVFTDILSGLAEGELAQWMRAFNPGKAG